MNSGIAPRAVSFALAASTAIAAFFLARLAAALFPAGLKDRGLWIGLGLLVGLLGVGGRAVIGSTMNEWPPAALILAALSVLVSSTARDGSPSFRALAIAGILGGAAAGLKLPYGVFGAALAVGVMSFGPWRARVRRAFLLGCFLLAGFLAAYGFWGAILMREFGNPFFPYFNSIFASPWWEPVSFFDRTFGPRDALQAIFFPFFFALQSSLVSEQPFRDWRFAALFALAVACAVKFIRTRTRPAAPAGVINAWRLAAVFALAGYLAWLKVSAIYRYLVPLEALTGILIVGCALYLLQGAKARRAGVAIVALAVIASSQKLDLGRLEYRERWFEVTAPALAPGSLVIVGVYDPKAYVIPFLRADARFVSPFSNFLRLDQGNLLARRAAQVIAGHEGPIYSLDALGSGSVDATLAHYGLARDVARCQAIVSNIDWNMLRICPARRQREAP